MANNNNNRKENKKKALENFKKIKQGDLGTGADKPGKKEKVDPSIFKMANQKDY